MAMDDPGKGVVYRTDAFLDRNVIRPLDGPPAVGVSGGPDVLGPIGIAYPTCWIDADYEAGRPAETL